MIQEKKKKKTAFIFHFLFSLVITEHSFVLVYDFHLCFVQCLSLDINCIMCLCCKSISFCVCNLSD